MASCCWTRAATATAAAERCAAAPCMAAAAAVSPDRYVRSEAMRCEAIRCGVWSMKPAACLPPFPGESPLWSKSICHPREHILASPSRTIYNFIDFLPLEIHKIHAKVWDIDMWQPKFGRGES